MKSVQLCEKAWAAEITTNRIESYYADNNDDEFDHERVRRDNSTRPNTLFTTTKCILENIIEIIVHLIHQFDDCDGGVEDPFDPSSLVCHKQRHILSFKFIKLSFSFSGNASQKPPKTKP